MKNKTLTKNMPNVKWKSTTIPLLRANIHKEKTMAMFNETVTNNMVTNVKKVAKKNLL